jgi:two-component system alkaline phosphatase synthesis response regulator PhoP
MNSTEYKILLISPSAKEKNDIRQMLVNRKFTVLDAFNADYGIQKAIQHIPDLIICQNDLLEQNAFQVFNQLKSLLLKNGISFFIYSDKFEQEDILIGLEMGIDNFIVSPAEEVSLLSKIEHQFQKKKKFKIAEGERFRNSFDITPVAKIVLNNTTIRKANQAFCKLIHISKEAMENQPISDVFDFSLPEHALKLRKCMNGLLDVCSFEKVPLQPEKNRWFDIHLMGNGVNNEALFVVEIIPSSFSINDFEGESITSVSSAILNSMFHFHDSEDGEDIKLTQREQEVLSLSSLGLPVKQIADKLAISQRTIEKHRANIMQKTKSNSIIEAIHVLKSRNKGTLLSSVLF